MLTKGFECSLLAIGEILEEDQHDDQKKKNTQGDIVGWDLVIVIQLRLEQLTDLRLILRGEIVQLSIGMQMLNFELIDSVTAERGEENGQEPDEDTPEIVEKRMPKEDRRRRDGRCRRTIDDRVWDRIDNGRRFIVDAEGEVLQAIGENQLIRGDVGDGIEFLSWMPVRAFDGHWIPDEREKKEAKIRRTDDR